GETRVEEFPQPDLPKGVHGGTSFDDDAERFAVTVTGSTMNANVYVVDFETGEAERWTDASTAGIPRETFVEPELVRYESFDGLQVPAYFSTPRGEPPYPVVVDIHGGPESQRRPSFGSVKQYLLSHGYAVFEPNVRGSTGYGKEYTHLDVAMGGSYGGFMVLAALTEYPDLWAAGVDVVGIANFVTFLENTGEWRRELREEEYGSLDDDRDFLESISPTNKAGEIRAPLFVLHGENDPRVPVEEAEQIVERVPDDVPVEKLVFDDEGHGIPKLENRIEAYSRIVEFLDEHV
ncbi:MAG: prolyl oligopeptidase family serine peptidase, partial [Halobacteria archaeon]|nr:prolyl oligopeptidase family serine peptidase [Halobacteria archaeon]